MSPIVSLRIALLTGLAALSGGCGSSEGPTAAQTEASVTREARTAITVAAAALKGTATTADVGWYDCMPKLSWSYRGGGTFIPPHGDVAAQLASVRAALIGAGYDDTMKVEDKVVVERGGVSFVIGPRRIGIAPPRWSFSYQSACQGYSAGDRARVEEDGRTVIFAPGGP